MNKIKIKNLFLVLSTLLLLSVITVAQNPSADIDQCANGGVGSPVVICAGAAWQNGNVNSNQGHYQEGQFVPYRIKFANLVVGTPNTVTIEWDTTQGGKHAVDYIATVVETETTANACSGIVGCNLLSFTTFPIPTDANVTAGFDGVPATSDDITQVSGNFIMFGGTINSVSPYTLDGTYAGSSKTSITLTFTPSVANPVLAWSGHISKRNEWGFSNSAISINGSPYHMRLIELNGSGGNQDRALSAEAVIFPAFLTVVKNSMPDSPIDWTFTTTGLTPTTFVLDDDAGTGHQDESQYSNTQIYQNLSTFGVDNPKTVTEQINPAAGHWTLLNLSACVETSGGAGSVANSTFNLSTRSFNIVAEEGELITCTFVNSMTTAAGVEISGQVTDFYGKPIYGAVITVTSAQTGVVKVGRSNSFGYYTVDDLEVGEFYQIQATAKRYTFLPQFLSLRDSVANYNIIALY